MGDEPNLADLLTSAPGKRAVGRQLRKSLQHWQALCAGNDLAARVALAPQLAEQIMRLPGDPTSSDRVVVLEPILRRGIADAQQLGDQLAVLSGVCLLLQIAEVPLPEGEELINECLPALELASVGHARTLLIVAAEFYWHASHQHAELPPREALLRRALDLLQPLLTGTFDPDLEWQHLVLAARVHNELGEMTEAEPLLQRATGLVPPGSPEWLKAAVELGLTRNDLEDHEGAADVLLACLPYVRAGALRDPESAGYVHRGFDLSDVATALAESLAQLQQADLAFEILGLAFVDDDGRSDPCDLGQMCSELAGDELGVLFCVNSSTTLFLFDRSEALRVRVIPQASSARWLETFQASGWLESTFRPGRTDDLQGAITRLNDAIRDAFTGLHDELVGRYRSLTIIPHRSVSLLPFWLLFDGGDVTVRLVPSPGLLASRVRQPSTRMLSIADPGEDLPNARIETEAVSQRVGGCLDVEQLVGDQCTVTRTLAALPGVHWWHFAGHAWSDIVAPENSFLQLHPSPDEPHGVLAATAFRRLDLSGLDLVVLSACSSGVPEVRIDGVTRLAGLAALLLQQGVGTVVSTLWEISDDCAALVVDQFIGELLLDPTMDVPAALGRSTLHVRTMSSESAAARFEEIAARSSSGSLTEAALLSAQRRRASRSRAPFRSVDQWGAFFTSGGRFISPTRNASLSSRVGGR